MTQYGITTGPLIRYWDNPDVADVPASFWGGMGAAAGEGFHSSFGAMGYRELGRAYVEGGGDPDQSIFWADASDFVRKVARGWSDPQVPMLTAEEANDRFAIGDLKFDGPVSLYRAADLNRLQKEMLRRQDIVRRSQIGFFPQFVAGLGGAALDPVNIAAALVPAGILARTGLAASRTATLGSRVAYGAAEGAIGSAALAPGTYLLSQVEDRPYTVADAMLDVAFGTALSAGLHAGVGAFQNWVKNRQPMPLVQQAVESMPYEEKVQLVRGAVADVMEGRPVTVSPLIQRAVEDYVAVDLERWRLSLGKVETDESRALKRMLDAEAKSPLQRLNTRIAEIETDLAPLRADADARAAEIRASLDDTTAGRLRAVEAELERVIPAARRAELEAERRLIVEGGTDGNLEVLRSIAEEKGLRSAIDRREKEAASTRRQIMDATKRIAVAKSEFERAAGRSASRAAVARALAERTIRRAAADLGTPLADAEVSDIAARVMNASPDQVRVVAVAEIDAIAQRATGERFITDAGSPEATESGNGRRVDDLKAEIARSKLDPWVDPEFQRSSEQATQAIEAADVPIKARSEDQGIGASTPEIREMDALIERVEVELREMDQFGALTANDKEAIASVDTDIARAEETGRARDLAAICLRAA